MGRKGLMKRLKFSELDPSFFSVHEVLDMEIVRQIVSGVKSRGDEALIEYTRKFDGVDIESFRVPPKIFCTPGKQQIVSLLSVWK